MDVCQQSRPYFLPASIDFASLSQDVRLALQTIVQPSYDELVLAAPTAIERSAGVSLTFLLALEVLDQFALGNLLDLGQSKSGDQSTKRESLIARHLRVISEKQAVSRFLVRLQSLRAKQDPFAPRFRVPRTG